MILGVQRRLKGWDLEDEKEQEEEIVKIEVKK